MVHELRVHQLLVLHTQLDLVHAQLMHHLANSFEVGRLEILALEGPDPLLGPAAERSGPIGLIANAAHRTPLRPTTRPPNRLPMKRPTVRATP